jgi:hypothetical protein
LGDDRSPCPVAAEELGIDYAAAVARVERVLLPLFDSWRRRRGLSDLAAKAAPAGTFDWLVGVYRESEEFTASYRLSGAEGGGVARNY